MANDLIIRPHVLSDRDEIRADFDDGVTLQDIVDSVWPVEVHDNVVMAINGGIVPRVYWARVRPKQGAFVRGVLVFTGGGGGKKNVLGVIASIALAIAAPYAAAGIMGTTVAGLGVAGTALAAGITIVGNMAIGAIFKPPALSVGGGGGNEAQASRVYSITGQSNQATPYGTIPRLYGKHKLFPRIAATPFVDSVGADQFLYMIVDFGYGPLEVSDILIGETPISSYRGVQYRIHPSFVAGNALELYTADIAFETVAVELNPAEANLRVTENDTVRINVDLAFPRGLIHISSDGSHKYWDASIRIRIAPAGSGQWIGFNAYPGSLSHTAARSDFVGVESDGAGVVTLKAETYIGTEGRGDARYGLKAGTDNVLRVGGGYPVVGNYLVMSDGAEYKIIQDVFGAYLLDRPLEEDYVALITDGASGAGGTLQVAYAIGYTNPGNANGLVSVRAKDQTPFNVSCSITVPKGKYDVEVTRMHPAHDPKKIILDDCAWTGLRSAADRPPLAPKVPHTIMELKLQASDQLQGVIQNLSAVCTSILPVWDGFTWTDRATRNPAWAWCDIVRGKANARRVSDDRLDLGSVLRWAQYCDSQIDNGKGLEARFYFDHVVDYTMTVYQALGVATGAGRATLTWRDNKIGVIMDEEQTTPVQIFTPRNSWGFNTSRKYLDYPHAFRVKFTDPYNGYQQGTTIVYADGYDELTATKFEDLDLLGVTRSTQAWRDGRYLMYQGFLRREEFTIETDLENLACLRGDLVWVQHDVLRVGGDSSRVSTVVSSTVIQQFDALPTLPAGNYGVRIRLANGQIIGPIQATPTLPNTWTLSSPPATPISVYDLIVWGELGIETGEYLIKNIMPGNDFNATVTMVEIARAIYGSDSGVMPPYVPPANGRPDYTYPEPVKNLRVVQYNRTVNRRPVADIYVEWDAPRYGNYPKVRVYEQQLDSSLVLFTEANNTNKVLLVRDHDIITSRYLNTVVAYGAQAVDFVGAQSAIVYTTEGVYDPLWVPDPVPFFSSNVNGSSTTLTWREPLDQGGLGNQQIIAYDIRWSTDVDAQFERASRVSEVMAWNTFTTTVPTRNGVYLIKPITSSGVTSKTAARTVTITQDIDRKDWYKNIRFDPAWEGQFVNCENVSNALRLTIDPDTGGYWKVGYWIAKYHEEFNQELISRVTTHLSVYGYRADELLSGPRWTPIELADPIQEFASQEYDAKMWIAGSDRLSTVIADWVPISSAVPLAGTSIDLTTEAWPIISGEVQAHALYFIIELRSFDLGCTPVVVEAGADIDFPERGESHADVATPPAGARLVFNYPFVYTPNIACTLQNAQPGEFVQRTNADQYGVDLVVKNSTGAGVTGLIDVQVWGVGRVI